MEKSEFSKKVTLITGIVLASLAFLGFIYQTGIIANALVLIIMSIFLIAPLRKHSDFANRFLILTGLTLVGWITANLGITLIPFLGAFLFSYLLDPLVTFLDKKHIPRWLSALIIVLACTGLVTLAAVFIFPIIFDQLDNVIKQISFYVKQGTKFVESDGFYRTLRNFGLPKETAKSLIHEQLLPRMEGVLSVIFTTMLSLLTSLSTVATQIVNAILVPILTFYFLKDFGKFKNQIKLILTAKNEKMLTDLRRINSMLKRYIGWQLLSATIIATFASISYSIFGVPYAIVLGVLAGVVNPIPYVGTMISVVIGTLTIILVNEGNILSLIIVVASTISGLHFINAYLLEPNIAGKQVGLHPIMLIVALFVFGGLFGFIGLLIAVPSAAILMMFFNDWIEALPKNIAQNISKENE